MGDWCADIAEGEWDAQIERDIKAGKLKALAEAARKSHREGRSTEL